MIVTTNIVHLVAHFVILLWRLNRFLDRPGSCSSKVQTVYEHLTHF